jgi:hypothetical protein
VFRTSLKNIPSRIVFFIFFLYLSFVFIASVLLGFGEFGLLFLSGKQLFNGRSHNSYRLWTFLSSTTTPYGWIRGGYLDAFTTGRDPIQAACFILAFFLPSSLVLKKKTYTQQCTTLGSSPRQKLLYGIFADILGTFFFPSSFHMFGLERLLGRYPPTRTTPELKNSNRHILCFFPWLFPIHDDFILMTTFSTTR